MRCVCIPVLHFFFQINIMPNSGPGSSVSIATDYGLDGPGSNPGGDEIFHPSRPAVGPTNLPVKWVAGLSWGYKRLGRAADPPPPTSAEVLERVELYFYSPKGLRDL